MTPESSPGASTLGCEFIHISASASSALYSSLSVFPAHHLPEECLRLVGLGQTSVVTGQMSNKIQTEVKTLKH